MSKELLCSFQLAVGGYFIAGLFLQHRHVIMFYLSFLHY